jgi:hypothetical protein
MDFKPDGFRKMMSGKDISKVAVKIYRQLLASGDPANIDKAKKMYRDNDMHLRDPGYMDDHGEAGYYRTPGASGNKTKTDDLIKKAVSSWRKNPLESLSILSDALHQAEDRGSHGEGNPFEGHDPRLIMHEEKWEIENWKPGWEPDNMDVNTKGATLALGHAEKVLSEFKERIDLPEGKQIAISGFGMRVKEFFKRKRRMLGFGYLSVLKSSNPLTKLMGRTGARNIEDVKSIVLATLVKDAATRSAYTKARGNPGQEEAVLNPVVRDAVQKPGEHSEFWEKLETELLPKRPVPPRPRKASSRH